MNLNSKNKTLFLDRDGVINRRLVKRYVKNWDEFEFLPGVLEAIPIFNKFFDRIIVVTNQRGIGLALMSIDELEAIHSKLLQKVKEADGKIDHIYYCSKLIDELPNCRKPEPFMALQAKKDFPEISFTESIMVGDQPGDIEFGNNLAMKTVWIPNEPEMKWEEESCKPDYTFDGLIKFARFLEDKTYGKDL